MMNDILKHRLEVENKDINQQIKLDQNEGNSTSNSSFQLYDQAFKSYFELSQDSIFILHNEVFIDCNLKTLELFKCSKNDIIGKAVAEYSPEFQPDGSKSLEASMKKINDVYDFGPQFFEWKHIKSDGTEFFTEVNLISFRNNDRRLLLAIVRDINLRKRDEIILKSRLDFIEFTRKHNLDDLLIKILDKIESLTSSKIGFFHFVNTNQQDLSLQVWSTQTSKYFCNANVDDKHYSIDKAGVWVQCIRMGKPVIHNNYDTLENKSGLPEGHSALIRELLIPIQRNGKIVAIIGVGNKQTDYDDDDLDLASKLGDIAWDIAEKLIVENELIYKNTIFQAVLDNMPAGLFVIDAQTQKTILSNNMADLLLGKQNSESYSIESMPDYYSAYIAGTDEKYPYDQMPLYMGLQGKKIHTEDMEIERDNGRIQVSVSGAPVYDEQSSLIGSVAVFTDITERKKSQAMLVESEKRFRLLADSAPILMWMAGLDKLCNYFNRTWLEFTGRTYEQEFGNGWAEGVHTDDFNRILEIYQDSFDKHESFQMEYRLKRYDGEYRWILDKGTPRFGENKEFLGYIGVCVDIHESKLIQESMIKLLEQMGESKTKLEVSLFDKSNLIEELTIIQEELKDSNDKKDKFFSIIARDLRSPFNGFLSLTKILVDQFYKLPMKELYEVNINLQKSAINLYKLLENLLEWSKLQRGIINFSLTANYLRDLVMDNISLNAQMASQKSISIETQIPGGIRIFADANMVNHIFKNLISNAIKFSNRGSKVILTARELDKRFVEIVVQDFGVGIPENEIEKLFVISEKMGKLGTEGEESTGLGLILCNEYVKKHNCEIWVESELGVGTKVFFTLPNYNS